MKKEAKERKKLQVPRQQFSTHTLLEENQIDERRCETDYQGQYSERQQVKSKFSALYKRIGWSIHKKPLEIETIYKD